MKDSCQICESKSPFLLHYDGNTFCYYHHNQQNRKDPYLKKTIKGNIYNSKTKANK